MLDYDNFYREHITNKGPRIIPPEEEPRAMFDALVEYLGEDQSEAITEAVEDYKEIVETQQRKIDKLERKVKAFELLSDSISGKIRAVENKVTSIDYD